MAGPLSAFSGDFKLHKKVAELIIAPLDDEGKIDEDLGGARVLQFYPDSIEDSKSAEWQSRSIPGAPLPMYQWVSGSERSFSLTAVFTRDMNGEIGKDVEEDKYNVDIDAAIAWLRMLASNDYVEIGDAGLTAVAPPILWLHAVGTKMGYNLVASQPQNTEGGGVHCILTEVGVTRSNWFQDGTVRKASVSLAFNEVMQIGQGIYPYGRSDFLDMASAYTRKPSK